MRNALIAAGAALVIWWLWKNQTPTNPVNVNPDTTMTGAGQDATVFGPLVSEGTIRGTFYDGAAAKAAAKAYAAKPVTSKLSLFRAICAVNAQTPPAPAPIPNLSQIHGTTAVTQIT